MVFCALSIGVLITTVYSDGHVKTTLTDFHCKIIAGGSCGEGNLGVSMQLNNTNVKESYKVTVRVSWQKGTELGSYDKVFTVPAGGRVKIGCTRGQSSGAGQYISSYTYTVVGETSS